MFRSKHIKMWIYRQSPVKSPDIKGKLAGGLHLWHVMELQSCIREITRGSVMCRYLTANDLIYDRMNTLYNIMAKILK